MKKLNKLEKEIINHFDSGKSERGFSENRHLDRKRKKKRGKMIKAGI